MAIGDFFTGLGQRVGRGLTAVGGYDPMQQVSPEESARRRQEGLSALQRSLGRSAAILSGDPRRVQFAEQQMQKAAQDKALREFVAQNPQYADMLKLYQAGIDPRMFAGEKRQTYKPELVAFKNHTKEDINIGGIIVKPEESRSFNISNPDIANALMNTAGLEQVSKGTVYTRQGGLYKTPDGTYRELLIGDQQVFKGPKGTLTTKEFYDTYSQDEISTTTSAEGYRYTLDKKSFDKLNTELVDLEKGFLQLERYWENIKDTNIGLARLGDQISQWYKTLQGDTGLSYEELKRGVASGQLQRLIGANRIDTVGGGVMTEKDAWRVIEGLGGDVTLLQNPAIVSKQLQDMYLYKTLDYNKILKSYNDEIATGNFPSYKEKTPIDKKTVINKFSLLPEGVPAGSVRKVTPNGIVYYLDEKTGEKYIVE